MTTKTWQRTRLQNLVRHKSAGYYARLYAGGKEVWKSLNTSHFSVAQAKLAELLKEHRKRTSKSGNGEVPAKMRFGEAAAAHLRNLDDNLRMKPRTRDYWRECLVALQKSWLHLNETEIRKITQADCKEWARAYGKTVSPTRYNNTVSILRHVLNVAVEAGVVYSNAAAAVKRVSVRSKDIALPTIEQFNTLIVEMRNGHSGHSNNCADLAAGLAYTGLRVGEAREVALRDLDLAVGELVVRGDPTTGTKNWQLRRLVHELARRRRHVFRITTTVRAEITIDVIADYKSFTPPTASTVPATSQPRISGSFNPNSSPSPSRIFQSTGFTAAAFTFTSTWSAPGCGCFTSAIFTTSSFP